MNSHALKVTEQEARRFLSRVTELNNSDANIEYGSPSKERAAVKRSSMDLTRALADLRRPDK